MMKKGERVLRQILYLFYERNERFMSQKAIAEACEISLGTVNPIINRIDQLGAIEKKPLGFRISDASRILMYWANYRNLRGDVIYTASTNLPPEEIEGDLPRGSILTAYSGFRTKSGEVPAAYHEVYIYADPSEIKKRFPKTRGHRNNIVVLKPDEHLSQLSKDGIAPLGQIYVDLWQLGEPAKIFVDRLAAQIRLMEVGALKGIIERTRERPA